jgi:SNF2 family DNA or RNA helicase
MGWGWPLQSFFGGGFGASNTDGAQSPPPEQQQRQQFGTDTSAPSPPGTIDPRQLSSIGYSTNPYQGNGIQPAMTHPPQYSPNSHPAPVNYSDTVQAALHGTPYSQTPQYHSFTPQPYQHARPPVQQQSPYTFSSPQQQIHGLPNTSFQQQYGLTSPGPKQSRKPAPPAPEQNGSSSNVSPAAPRFDPRTLLNPRAANSRPNTPVQQLVGGPPGIDSSDSQDQSAASSPGMGGMLERLHNVGTRDSAPRPKKRKSDVNGEEDASPDRKKSKATFNGAIAGGPLAEHMKAEREKFASQNGPSTSTIDLTADDDGAGNDEVQFVKENAAEKRAYENEEVCLGAITGGMSMHKIPWVGKQFESALGKDYWPLTKMSINRQRDAPDTKVEVLDQRNKVCGFLEAKMAMGLSPLMKGNVVGGMRFRAYLPPRKRQPSDVVHMATSETAKISIVLYCMRKVAITAGKYLSQKQLWLQSPSRVGVPSAKENYNPHEPPGSRHGGPSAGSSQHPRPQTTQSHYAPARTAEEVRRDAANLFDNLPKHEDLPETEPKSGLITTALLPHQKKALTFLMQHELEDDSADGTGQTFSLWRPKVDERGNKQWQHAVTDQILMQKPGPVRGGILADMMGLGKTLSILSLIAETREEAKTFYNSPPPNPTVKRNAIGTLIICPKSVLSNWQEQLRAHTIDEKFRCYMYHGSNRIDEIEELAKFNIVLTTYNTASSDFNAKGKALFSLNWFRIVLDEAHSIRTQTSQMFKAAYNLNAQRRWAVTGTPVQNKLEDMHALIKFLRVMPFDQQHQWVQYIISPLRSANPDVHGHLRLLIDSITLRRQKDTIGLKDRQEEIVRLKFSPKDYKVYKNMAGDMGTQLKRLTAGNKGRIMGKAYAHVLKSIGLLRMFCAHGLDMMSDDDRKEVQEGMNEENAIDLGDDPDLEDYVFVTDKQAYETFDMAGDLENDKCEMCGEKVGPKKSVSDDEDSEDEETSGDEQDETLGYLTPCYHFLCTKCRPEYEDMAYRTMTADMRHKCPCCTSFVRMGMKELLRSGLDDFREAKANAVKKRKEGRKEKRTWDDTDYDGPSVKVQTLIAEIYESVKETEALPAGEPPIRSVVFSGWTTFLDLIEVALDEHNFGYVRLDGTMSVKQRSAVLHRFANDPSVTIILVSIKAGGQGLNFTAANKVYMMEPQFNPGVEQQAIDRVHRLGQERDVFIKHYIMSESVEEGILKLQKKKEDLAKFTLERKMSRLEESKKRIEELRELFK